MDCKIVQRLIPPFLAGNLKGKKLLAFAEHIEKCKDCKEELTIQYLSSEGIARLEEGKTFDLERELQEYMNNAIRKQKRRKYFAIGICLTEILAIIVIGLIFAYALLW